jgi:hypothetical protein
VALPKWFSIVPFTATAHITTTTNNNNKKIEHSVALCYKPERRGFEIRRGELNSSIYLIFPAALGSGGYSASKRNAYQKEKNHVSGKNNMAGTQDWQP